MNCFLIALFSAACLPLAGQVSSVRVFTEPDGLQFYVDGQLYTKAATFLWPTGSKHVLNTDLVQTAIRAKTRYTYVKWTDSNGVQIQPGATITVSADPAVTALKATFTTEYAVVLNFFNCPSPDPQVCKPPGTVYVNNTPYTSDTDIYLAENSQVNLQASPNPGFVFVGWLQGIGNNLQSFLNAFVLNRPYYIYPKFAPTRPVQLLTDPPGLQVLAERAAVYTPITYDWGQNTTHTLGVVSPQRDQKGKTWVFDTWSDGGEATHAYTVAGGSSVLMVTAKYVPAATITFLTDPPGLKLTIDGRQNWQNYTFAWNSGSKHTVSAAQNQVDAAGRPYVFQGWSNGGPATQDIVVDDGDVENGRRVTAIYQPLSRITVQTNPSGLVIRLEDKDCTTPCIVERTIGAQIPVAVPAVANATASSRLAFQSWSDGGAPERTIKASTQLLTVTAVYVAQNRLSISADVPEGVRVTTEPPSADSFYNAQDMVEVSAEIRPGFRFRGWEGDAAGQARTIMLSMASPKNVRAMLERVPYIGPAGIRNAAGETPQVSVAPGSIISIAGSSLAPWEETRSSAPLPQTIADVTVRWADRLLPMLFVSPDRVDVQLPSDIPEGPQRLTVRWEGHPEISGDFLVERNAPGLFHAGDQNIAVALHQDGTPVNPDSPARAGELLTLLGTGFGPTQMRSLDGFPAPADLPLIDPVDVLAGDAPLTPEFAGSLSGRIGIQGVRLRIPYSLAGANTLTLTLRVNGRDSNTVSLPLLGII